jgi:hypothetical protein
LEEEVMNVALLIASLLFGVVDPPTGDNSNMPGIAPPTSDIPLQPELRSAIQKHTRTGRTKGVPASQAHRTSGTNTPQSMNMPMAPTGDQDDQSSYGYGPPTAPPTKGGASMGTGRSSGLNGNSRLPNSPTHPRPGMAKSYNSQQDAQLLQMRLQAAQQATSPAVQQPASKAFAGTQAYSGGPSPYMNLYRTGTNNGTIDNYTSLVRPEINQRQTNQRFGADINSLETSSRVQGFNLQQLHRDTQNLQGVKYQQFFMNYGDFYPGAK